MSSRYEQICWSCIMVELSSKLDPQIQHVRATTWGSVLGALHRVYRGYSRPPDWPLSYARMYFLTLSVLGVLYREGRDRLLFFYYAGSRAIPSGGTDSDDLRSSRSDEWPEGHSSSLSYPFFTHPVYYDSARPGGMGGWNPPMKVGLRPTVITRAQWTERACGRARARLRDARTSLSGGGLGVRLGGRAWGPPPSLEGRFG